MTLAKAGYTGISLVILLVLQGCGRGSFAEPKSPAPQRERAEGYMYATATADSDKAKAEPAPAEAPPPPPAPGGYPNQGGQGQQNQPSQPTSSTTTPATPPADPGKDQQKTRDLVIFTARLTMAVYQVDQGLSTVEKIARDQGGYLGQKKDHEITIRVPRSRFDTALASVDRIGDVVHRDIQAEDVTDEHVDLEIRIKNARSMQHRLQELLLRAPVKEALDIEKELHRVTEELERLEGKMKLLKDRVAFSTITVTFEPRGNKMATSRVNLPFPWISGMNLPALLSLSEDK